MICDNCLGTCEWKTTNGIKEKGIAPISAMYYILTENCNLSCAYCFVHQKPKNMSLEVAMDATKWLIAQCEANGTIPHTNFFGGEPLLRWDEVIVPVTKYVREVYGKPFDLGITTNGVLLDEDKLRFMKQNNFGLLLSIDGPKDIQDKNRPMKNGQSSFDIIYPRLPMILKEYPNLTFRSTIDHDDKDVLVRIFKFAVEQGYNNIFCIPNNLSDWTEEEIAHLQKQLRDLFDYWMDLFREGKIVEFNPMSRAMNEINRINIMNAKNQRRTENDIPGYGKCGIGGTGFCSVNWEGKLYSCQEMVGNTNGYAEEFCIGSIYTGVDEHKRVTMTNKFNVQNVRSSKEWRCNNCILDSICSGYCAMNNVIKSKGDIHIHPEVSCVFYETIIYEMIRMMNIMSEERNEVFRKFYLSKYKHKAS